MIFWLRLKLDLLPCIAQEIDKVSAEYLRLIENFKRGDKSALQNILVMQAAIKARIEEIDAFYEKNYTDYRIAYFEKLKIKLRKLLYTSIETGIKTPEPALNSHINDPFRSVENTQPNSFSKKNDYFASEEEKLITGETRPISSQAQQNQDVSPTRANKLASSSTIQNGKEFVETKATGGTITKTSNVPEKKRASINLKGKEAVPNRASTAKVDDRSNKPVAGNKDEIVFTIKMTKEEYMQFLQTKAAKGK